MTKRMTVLLLAGSLCVAVVMHGRPATSQPQPPTASNAALRYWMAMALLREVPLTAEGQALLDQTASGRAPWNEAVLAPTIAANAEAIATLRRGASLPECDWGLDWSLGPQTPVAHLPKSRVLGRLVALAALQRASLGQSAEATDLWLSGITFAKHIARDGSLISALTARTVLSANLRSMTQAATSSRFQPRDLQRMLAAVQAVPRGGFDWAGTIDREAASLDVMIKELRASQDRPSTYRQLTGSTALTPIVVPDQAQVQQFHTLMRDLAAALRLAPDETRAELLRLATARDALPLILRDSIPALDRVNAARIEVEDEKRVLLSALESRR